MHNLSFYTTPVNPTILVALADEDVFIVHSCIHIANMCVLVWSSPHLCVYVCVCVHHLTCVCVCGRHLTSVLCVCVCVCVCVCMWSSPHLCACLVITCLSPPPPPSPPPLQAGIYLSRKWSSREGILLAVLSVACHMLSILYLRFAYHKFYEGKVINRLWVLLIFSHMLCHTALSTTL